METPEGNRPESEGLYGVTSKRLLQNGGQAVVSTLNVATNKTPIGATPDALTTHS